MVRPENLLADSPADFDSSLAYALHGEMRRLLIVTIVGSILLPVGLAIFIDPAVWRPFAARAVRKLFGLVIAIIGAGMLYGGLIAVIFKVITDAMILGQTAIVEQER